MRKKTLLIFILFTLILTGCTSELSEKNPMEIVEGFSKSLSNKENIVFLSNTTIHREDKMASVNLKGVNFLEANQIYYLGNAAETRLELFKDGEQIFIKNTENKWTSLEAGGASEIASFVNEPTRLLEYAKYVDLDFLERKARIDGSDCLVLTGSMDDTGISDYIRNFIPELEEKQDEVIIEMSIYIDERKGSLRKIDIFINELSGDFSLVSEITISDYNVNTEIIPPK